MKRGVRIGATFLYFPFVSEIHRAVSSSEAAALSSRRMSGLLRSMLTLPTSALTPVSSMRSISSSVAGRWIVPNTAARVVGEAARSSAKMR